MSLRLVSGRDHYLLDSPRARAEARRVTARAQRARARSRHTNPPLYPLSTLLLLLLGVWTFLGVFILGYPYTAVGQNSVLRVLGAAVVLMLCALRLRIVGFSRIGTALAGLVGAALVASAIWLPHQVGRIRANEGLVGALVIIVCLAVAATRRQQAPSQRQLSGAGPGSALAAESRDGAVSGDGAAAAVGEARGRERDDSVPWPWISIVRAVWGCLLLLAPGWVSRRLRWAEGERRRGRLVVRVLGARQLVQAGVTARWPGRGVLGIGAGTDLLHAATAAWFAASGPGRRVAGGVDTMVAATFAAAEWRARGNPQRHRRSTALDVSADTSLRVGR